VSNSSADPVAAFATYWSSLAQGRVPERALLAPEAIIPLLPLLLLVEFETEPFRVRYRLTGTQVDQWNGMSIVGRYLDDLIREDPNPVFRQLAASYRACHDSAQPVMGDYEWPTRQGGILNVRFGMFPLLLKGVVRQCVAIEDYRALPHRYEHVTWRR
jgi:hypothetical protein